MYTGSKILDILREEEKKARLNFWRMLIQMSGQGALVCPFGEEPPEGAVYFGPMPENMRGAFMRAYKLRTEERRAEAEIFEEALNDLMQEYFRHELRARSSHGEAPIGYFRLGKDWSVYAMPFGH